MADGLSLVLWSLAEYFNYFSVTLIILCSGLMTAFIIRLNGDNLGRYHNGVSQGGSSLAYQKDVTSFSNPFFLKLSSSTISSLANGVWAEVSCLVPCKVHVYWGALVNPLHAALLKSGTDFLEDVRANMLLSGSCLATERHSLQTEGKNPIHLTVPEEVDADKLGPTPRQRYPCVLVMTTRNSLDALEYTDVVAVVSILHLKDSKCAMETHIIAQYAKMAGQAVYNLQPLFFASELDEDDGRPSSQHSDNMKSSTEEENKTCSAQDADTSQLSRHTGNAANQDTDTSGRQSSNTLNTPLTEPGGEVYDGCSQDHRPAGSGSSGDSDFPHKPSSPQPDLTWQSVFPECIICQSRPLNCALLPCRHTCVCQVCFHKLDRCPMCRSHIESYFTLSDEDDDDDIGASSPPDEAVASDLQSRFERFNHRLNSLFGFD